MHRGQDKRIGKLNPKPKTFDPPMSNLSHCFTLAKVQRRDRLNGLMGRAILTFKVVGRWLKVQSFGM